MPLCGRYVCGDIEIAVWKIEETIGQLSSLVDSATLAESGKFTGNARRCEWLAVRCLLRRLLGDGVRIVYDAAGKPSLEGSDMFVGISHSRGYAAVALSGKSPFGLDVELASRDVGAAAHRFMREEELDGIAPCLHNDAKLIRWTASEALYKLVGDLGGNFRDNIVAERVLPAGKGLFTLTVVGVAHGNGDYSVSYLFDGQLLVTVCRDGELVHLCAV